MGSHIVILGHTLEYGMSHNNIIPVHVTKLIASNISDGKGLMARTAIDEDNLVDFV